jgi:hypothetical protein
VILLNDKEYELYVERMLDEADLEAELTDVRYTLDQVIDDIIK